MAECHQLVQQLELRVSVGDLVDARARVRVDALQRPPLLQHVPLLLLLVAVRRRHDRMRT